MIDTTHVRWVKHKSVVQNKKKAQTRREFMETWSIKMRQLESIRAEQMGGKAG